MFRKDLLLHKPIAERLQRKIENGKYEIEMEIGTDEEDEMVVVKFMYKDYYLLSGLLDEAVNEEYDLIKNN